MKNISIFTPTYNRAHLLPKLYESLKKQTNKNFVWLIIDDGSTDGTKCIVEKWQKEKIVKIEYYYKQNGGKNTAMDFSNKVCKTEYIACVDSDDILTENAIEVLYKNIEKIKSLNVIGIVFRKAFFNKKPFSEAWCDDYQTLFFYELAEKYGYMRDTFLIFKTNIIKQFKFPHFENEKFVTESVFYNQFLYDYKILAAPEIIYLADYQEDGYTKMGLKVFQKNPNGFLYALKQNAYFDIKKRKISLLKKIISISKFYGWKRLFKLEDPCKGKYEANNFYKLMGKTFSFATSITYKRRLGEK